MECSSEIQEKKKEKNQVSRKQEREVLDRRDNQKKSGLYFLYNVDFFFYVFFIFFLRPMQIALITGGTSPERPISLKSAQTFLDAFTSLGYTVSSFDYPSQIKEWMSQS